MSGGELPQNPGHRLTWIGMCRDGAANHEIIRARLDRLPWCHEAFLVAGFRPTRTYSRRHNLDFVAEFTAQRSGLMRTCYQSIDSCQDAEAGQSQNMIVNSF